MRSWNVPAAIAAVLTVLLLAGCASQGPSVAASPGSAPLPVLGSPFSDQQMGFGAGDPLIIDRTDLRIGTTVQFRRLPNASEIHDLHNETALVRVVFALPEWPVGFQPLEPLNQLPADIDVVVVLHGYPPSRQAAEVWNYLGTRLRLVVVADGPPPSPGVISDLNTMRGLERVIANLEVPARTGFEHLQRPLAFRRIVE
jgi:hypothetical protein